MQKVFALLFALTLLLPPTQAGAATECQDDAAANSLTAIGKAYDLLTRYFVDPLPAPTLLGAASTGADLEIQKESKTVNAAIQIANWPASPDDDWDVFAGQYCAVFNQSVDANLSPTSVSQAAMRAMAAAADDQHTNYLSPSAYRDQRDFSSSNQRYVGIGASLTRDPFAIGHVFPDSPAEVAGLEEGDLLLAVDHAPIAGLAPEQLSAKLRGEADTIVVLTVLREGWDAPRDISVKRGVVRIPITESKIIDNVGYVRLNGFTGPPAYEQVAAQVNRFNVLGLDAMVLDMRGNPGGRVDIGGRIATLFLPDGTPLLQQTTRRGRTTTVHTIGAPTWEKPVVVLVDGNTASMGEILAAAMQEAGAAPVFGQTSAGAVAGSLVFPLPDGSAMQITTVHVNSGLGQPLDHIGVQPDFEVAGRRPGAPGNDAALGVAVDYLQSIVGTPADTAALAAR
ncbi:MAG: carboxyl-terminal processing protease [Chloroflexota bacterium]|nr:carboxyl-terminal processing protease [Chloroflexota bacterium]